MANEEHDLTADHPNRATRGQNQQKNTPRPGETNLRASRVGQRLRNPDGTLIEEQQAPVPGQPLPQTAQQPAAPAPPETPGSTTAPAAAPPAEQPPSQP